MDIVPHKNDERKLKAVIVPAVGVFLINMNGGIGYISKAGVIVPKPMRYTSLEEVLNGYDSTIAIYEGEGVSLSF